MKVLDPIKHIYEFGREKKMKLCVSCLKQRSSNKQEREREKKRIRVVLFFLNSKFKTQQQNFESN